MSKIQPCKVKVIYLDNNGTTKMCQPAQKAMVKWLGACANPSADSVLSAQCKKMIEQARAAILKHCGVSKNKYAVIFTSGASESNCSLLRSVADAYRTSTGKKPHIITSSIEHKSILKCCHELAQAGKATISYIPPNVQGLILPELVEKSIRPNTALVSIMAANNELGSVNNIRAIGAIAHKKKVPFHTDAVQTFGKFKIPMARANVDALSMSFHKLYGPMGTGLLVLNRDLVKGYGLQGQISGSQQDALRGGTENVPAIAASAAAMAHTFRNRKAKNVKMAAHRAWLIKTLEKILPRGDYGSYFDKKPPKRNEFVVLGAPSKASLPNTLLLSFAKNANRSKPFCNVNLKKSLDKHGIVVSVGSACSTKSKKASHVLQAIRAPLVIKQGIIRISMSDHTTKKDLQTFVKVLTECLKKQGMF